MIEELILKNRSCRRFYQDHSVDSESLKSLVNLARLSASAGNLQPLKYILSCDPEMNAQIFSCLAWAGYLKDWPGPDQGERPSAYIIILGDTEISKDFGCDHGIASQSILLGAKEKGLAGCIIGAINREKLRDILNIPAQFKILLALAMGKPKEEIVTQDVGTDGSIRYWRDDKGVHHVPKRSSEEIILNY
ncbi:nitroreductase family protein [Desulfonema magnum]|uniref:Nitroreductase n=1 Tax=Desulfonema magnum TaxID=45655 RepID=A0A975BWQ6_9BACT|nr:nitroreductase family protein [Desulfonema magnum]QTA92718.1 Nitroreductase [Desulfonema magnum]